MSKRRKNRGGRGNVGDCLNEFRRMFLEYSGILYLNFYRPDSHFPELGNSRCFSGSEIPEIEKFIFPGIIDSRIGYFVFSLQIPGIYREGGQSRPQYVQEDVDLLDQRSPSRQ